MWPFDKFRVNVRKGSPEIEPDEILIDSSNPASFDRERFEGRMERPLGRISIRAAALLVVAAVLVLGARVGHLQLIRGEALAAQARENQLQEGVVVAERGSIEDRAGRELAFNHPSLAGEEYAARVYAPYRGVAHAVGYVKPPAKDSSGFYFRDTHVGVSGAESVFDGTLRGENGRKLTETDARGEVVSEAVQRPPRAGLRVTLSIDAEVSQHLYDVLAARASAARARGAAGVVMDIHTGELLALTSYPEYPQQKLADGDAAAIDAQNASRSEPFLNRAVDGLYAPGSIIKPMVAAGALNDGVIGEYTQILSEGSITIPNPYDASRPSVFRDWRVNGWTDARAAIAVSSDIYFYAVGGGYQDQKGLGIARIDHYLGLFGFGQDAGLAGYSSALGTIPTPEWKERTFPDDPAWRLGNTYHTAIGQYGVLTTPLQAVRAIAAVASGVLVEPTILAGGAPQGTRLAIDPHALFVAREGMRQGVTHGIASAVNFPFVEVAAKTGTAQVGVRNEYQNAWMVGFWPYENPRFAYAVVLERAPAGTTVGGSAVMSDFFYWMRDNAPEYLSAEEPLR